MLLFICELFIFNSSLSLSSAPTTEYIISINSERWKKTTVRTSDIKRGRVTEEGHKSWDLWNQMESRNQLDINTNRIHWDYLGRPWVGKDEGFFLNDITSTFVSHLAACKRNQLFAWVFIKAVWIHEPLKFLHSIEIPIYSHRTFSDDAHTYPLLNWFLFKVLFFLLLWMFIERDTMEREVIL